jgi:hypothetical protein
MAKWGVTIDATDIATVRDARDFDAVVMAALEARAKAS